jgi:hypothetical protein
MEPTLKNDGSKGPLCNLCGGYGFTNSITGGSPGCQRCEQTGVEPVNLRELQQRVEELTQFMAEVKKLLEQKNE